MPRKLPIVVSRRWSWLAPVGVGLFAFVLYLPTVGYEFTFDDGVIVDQNPAVQEWGHWKLIFCSDYWPGSHSALYRPLTILSFAAERAIHGSSPAGFHLLNVTLHSLISVLVFLIATEFIGFGWGAVLAAALFAVHPIHTEVVSGAVGRAELLSTALALWAFWTYQRKVHGGKAPTKVLVGIPLFFFLALCSKENVVVLPAILLLWELSRPLEQPVRARLRELARSPILWGLLTAAAAFLMLRAAVLGGFGASLTPNPPFVENPLSREPPAARILDAVVNQAHGIRLQLFPHPLLADYSYQTLQTGSSWFAPGFLLIATLVLGIIALWMLRGKNAGNLAFASSWYTLAILPASNIPFVMGTIFGERLYYFPSVGFCLFLAVLWEIGAQRHLRGWAFPETLPGRTVLGVALAVLLALGTTTWLRNPAWQNDRALFTDTVAKAPSNVKARLWLGDALVRSGELTAGVAEYRRALEIYPQYPAPVANLMVPLIRLGRLDEAIETGEKARRLFPQENATLLCNLALAYLKVGNTARFLEDIQEALKIDPQSDSAQFQLGMYYLEHERNGSEARKHLEEALRLNPNSPHAAEIRRWLSAYR